MIRFSSNARTIVLSCLLLTAATPALAQFSPGGGIGGTHDGPPPSKGGDDEPKKAAPPPSIPGAVASPDTVAPAAKGAKDLDPNAALFDAINRGDMTSARDALSRGADLNARNVLGQRPLDMSIDLSRNNITFLLLSMRSQVGDPNAPSGGDEGVAASATTPGPAPVKEARHKRAVRRASPVEVATTQRSTTANAPQTSSGFLGFGAR
jgi:ankyrin repeat protein